MEGVAILLAKMESVQGKAAVPRPIRSTEAEPPTLVFSFPEELGNDRSLRQTPYEVGMRLANTVFLNGKENTLFGMRWAYDSWEVLKIEGSADLSICSVGLNPCNTRSSLELPLHPVGERRKVITSMGNILSQVAKHADGKSDEPMPASFELEKELPRYIDQNSIADQRVSVWALIEKSAESPYTKAEHSRSSLSNSIQTGAKLHRVMSGGGGWGKKQGLLSLDPEMSFGKQGDEILKPLRQVLSAEDEAPADMADTPLEPPSFMQGLSNLSQAAEPGDYVQFFASVQDSGPRIGSGDSPDRSNDELSCIFGVMSDAESFPSQTAGHKDLKIIPNYFGALSGKAITYSQPVAEPQLEAPETRTKIDVPGSRVNLVLE